jgi:GDP-4-dehydro-6-deoxy-D-mannose reductase
MRVLITGASGFAGRHASAHVRAAGAEVVGIGRHEPDAELQAAVSDWVRADLSDASSARDAVRAARPDYVLHLAAQASVAESWRDPSGTIQANVSSTVNLLDALAAEAPESRVLLAGSGEQYGPVAPERLPVTEDEPFRPQNPYAVSKCAVDIAAGFYADARGLHVIRARAFNHSGPGQHERYVVSSFARQIALAEAEGLAKVVVRTGDTRPSRDFTDVRDVARAYWLALQTAPVGVYNVCSGRALSVADILAGLARLSDLTVEQITDPALLRKKEVMEIRGSHDRLTDATGWQPEVPLERTLEDTLSYWRDQLRQAVTS